MWLIPTNSPLYDLQGHVDLAVISSKIRWNGNNIPNESDRYHRKSTCASWNNKTNSCVDGADEIHNNQSKTSHDVLFLEDKSLASQLAASSLEQCSVALKRKTVIYRNNYWQLLKTDEDEIVVYSAIFDDRPILGGQNFVRAFAAIKENHNIWSVKNDYMTPMSSYKCQLWYPGVGRPYISGLLVTRATYNMHRYNKLGLIPVLFSCPAANTTILPRFLSLSIIPCRTANMYLPITVPDPLQKHDFGICVASSYGTVPMARFIEWVEFHVMLGVTEFNIYNASMTPELTELFKYYTHRGLLNVMAIATPLDKSQGRSVKAGMMASMNDCMMRNMYKYGHVVLVDFDEIIVPYKDTNYRDLLRRVDASHGFKHHECGYSFRNALFHIDYEVDLDQPWFLHTMRHRYHTEPAAFPKMSKSFIAPKTCLSVYNHCCLVNIANLTECQKPIVVNHELALVHHYRSCTSNMSNGIKCHKTSIGKPENRVLNFKDELQRKVNNVLQNF